MSFHTTILLNGKTETGIEVPREVVEGLGAGKKPPVRVTINGKAYRSTIASRVDMPSDFAAALGAFPQALAFFNGLTHSQKQWFVLPIEQAKKPETRERRIEKAVGMLRAGRKA